MSTDDYGHLAYLVLLGCVVVFWFFAQNRNSLGKTLQMAVTWGLIFLGVIAAIGLWDDIRHTVQPRQSVMSESGQIVLPRAPDGHYYMDLRVNDKPLRFVVDTGASGIVLTQKAAEAIGIDTANLAYVGRAMSANGVVRTAPVTLDSIAIGDRVDRNLPAVVNEGEMRDPLLGMTYLQRFSKIEIGGGELVLIP